MKAQDLCCFILVCGFAFLAGQANAADATDSASQFPHFRQQGTATQLIVDGKPFLALCSEVGNNHATSLEFDEAIMVQAGRDQGQYSSGRRSGPSSIRRKASTTSGSWTASSRNAEPQPGFVPLWFASWKNSLSSYPPGRVKRNFECFPRAQTAGGRASNC